MCLPCLRTPVYDLPGLYRRRRVAQGESGSPGTAPVFTLLARVASDRSCAIVGCLLLSPTAWARRILLARQSRARGLALGYNAVAHCVG